MQRISSNATLLLKVFFPTFWIVFFGVFTVAVWMVDIRIGGWPHGAFRIGWTLFFLLWTAIFYLTFFKLKRVELDDLYLYASNYVKTYRYPYHNIERMTERDMGLFHLMRVYLKVPGKFGKRITFLLDEPMLKDFFEKNPEVAAMFGNMKIEEKK
ncbi:MAG: hypothetical protein H6577_08445 [Lewinellaceae bacterium]|nr:hypothetical protein [Saprospiraceae bacterium]MCB9338145.1 hypothetical protein [Lewinellaceae bacterium]